MAEFSVQRKYVSEVNKNYLDSSGSRAALYLVHANALFLSLCIQAVKEGAREEKHIRIDFHG